MHAKPDLRVLFEVEIAGSGSVITDVIHLGRMELLELAPRSAKRPFILCRAFALEKWPVRPIMLVEMTYDT